MPSAAIEKSGAAGSSPAGPAAGLPVAHAAAGESARPTAVALWLLGVAALVFCMVVIGGITRLTESGLSIVRWEPVSGIIPPLNEEAWQAEFEAYKAYPEYQKINRGMSLDEFRSIYMWEYLHRLLGRLIGIAFAVPLAWFALRRAIPAGYAPRLVLLFALGGLQGLVGWWMVKSGLIDRPDVAHERLAAHLLLALAIYAALIWTALDLLAEPRRAAGTDSRARIAGAGRWSIVLFALLFVQLLLGAFTAGLNAGYAFNTWPKMGEFWVPPGLHSLEPAWRNLIDNPVAIQFMHRTLAGVLAAGMLLFAWRLWRAGSGGRMRALLLAGAVLMQFLLGVLTLVHGVPITLGVLHQAGAALLLAALVIASHWSLKPHGLR
jgi:cytochrome c oxidase assembly protein subunit 15